MRHTLGASLALGLAVGLAAAPSAPVAQDQETVQTTVDGVVVNFESVGVVELPDQTLMMRLTFLSAQPLFDDPADDAGLEERMEDVNREICDDLSERLVPPLRSRLGIDTFQLIGITTAWAATNAEGRQGAIGWTSVYELDGEECGDRVRG